MSVHEKKEATNISILQHSLNDVQNAIRAYDVKAQIVSIGFIFSLGVIATVGDLVQGDEEYSFAWALMMWFLGVVPIAMFGYVLYPSRSHAPKLGTKVGNLQRSYYLLEERYPTLDSYLEAFDKSDWKVELAYEIQKSSLLRDLKRNRFVWALNVAGISFVLMFSMQLLRSVGLLD